MNLSARVSGLLFGRRRATPAPGYAASESDRSSTTTEGADELGLAGLDTESVRDCEEVIDNAYNGLPLEDSVDVEANRWPDDEVLAQELGDIEIMNSNNSARPPMAGGNSRESQRHSSTRRYEYGMQGEDSWSGPSTITAPPPIVAPHDSTAIRSLDFDDASRQAQAGSRRPYAKEETDDRYYRYREHSPIEERSRVTYELPRAKPRQPRPATTHIGRADSRPPPSTQTPRYVSRGSTMNPTPGVPFIDQSVATAMNILRQGKIWDPKFFNGKDWEEYKDHFEGLKELNGWDDDEALRILVTRLSGPASIVLRQRSVRSWTYTDAIAALDLHYTSNRSEFMVKSKLKGLRQLPGESVQDFALKIYKIAGGTFETQMQEDYELMDHFTYGLRDRKIAKKIVTAKPRIRTLNEALIIAKEKEEAGEWANIENPQYRLQSNTVDAPSKQVSGAASLHGAATNSAAGAVTTPPDLAASLEKIAKQMANLERRVNQPKPRPYQPPQQRSQPPPQSRAPRPQTAENHFRFGAKGNYEANQNRIRAHNRCYHCNEEGHFIGDCPSKNAGQPPNLMAAHGTANRA